MATAHSPKTWWPSCSAWVFRTHTNRPPGNTLITSRVLPIIKFQISLHKSCKKRTGEKPWLLDKACPSTSSQQQRTLGKSVPSVVKQTTPCRTTGLGGKNANKKGKGQSNQIWLEKRWTKRGRAKKRHQQVPMYYLYQTWPICLYKQHNQLIFHVTKWVRKWNGAWIVGALITSHQARVISSNITPFSQNMCWIWRKYCDIVSFKMSQWMSSRLYYIYDGYMSVDQYSNHVWHMSA